MRHPARLLLTGAALLVATACNNDASVAPNLGAPPDISGSPALAALATPTRVDFVIPDEGGRVSILGMYTVDFPAGAVCDPDAQDSKDGYASKSWDAPCTPASGDVAVHATLKWSYGRLWADFAPALRFVPGKTVTISTDVLAPLVRYYGSSAEAYGVAKYWGIGHASSIEGQVVDDSKSDRSLRTRVDVSTGRISRWAKHFSGYFLTIGAGAGGSCEPSPDNPFCVWYDVDPIIGGH